MNHFGVTFQEHFGAVVRQRTEHEENVLKNPVHKEFKSEYSVQILYIILVVQRKYHYIKLLFFSCFHHKRVDTLNAAIGEAIITFTYLAMQLGLRKVCKCFQVSKNLLTSFILIYINMTGKCTVSLLLPTLLVLFISGLYYTAPRSHGYIRKREIVKNNTALT